eukprot:753713-Hanusia_phi.AAC.1
MLIAKLAFTSRDTSEMFPADEATVVASTRMKTICWTESKEDLDAPDTRNVTATLGDAEEIGLGWFRAL